MQKPALLLLCLSYLAFVSLGLPDTVFGVAWPSLREGFGISQSAIGAALTAGMLGYLVSGLVAGKLIAWLGVGGLLAASSGVVTLALVGYALAPSWSLFFPTAAVLGLGSGAIDSGLNAYAARHFPVRHLNWLHACWGLGASIGPLIMTAQIASGRGYRVGYACLAAVLGAMTLTFLFSRRLWNDGATPANAAASTASTTDPTTTPLRRGAAALQIFAFFLYTGLETSVGAWCFTLLRTARGLGVEAAGAWTAAYWASLTLGRIVLGFAVDRVGPDRLLRWASLGVVGGVALFAAPGLPGRLGLLLLGLSLAPVYPTLMARTPARLGTAVAQHVVGFQVSAATLGAALLPSLTGVLVARFGLVAIGSFTLALGIAFLVVHELLLRTPDQALSRT